MHGSGFQALKRQDVLKLPWPALKNPPKPMTEPCQDKVGGKRWLGCSFRWTSDIHTGFCQQNLEDTNLHPMICQIWKIYLLAIWFASFPAAWQCLGMVLFFSSHENLTIANWYDFWNVFTFTNPMSRSAVSWGMVRGYNFWVPIWCPCDQRGCCYFNDLDWKKRLPVLVGEKRPTQRPKDVLLKPTSLTYATEN